MLNFCLLLTASYRTETELFERALRVSYLITVVVARFGTFWCVYLSNSANKVQNGYGLYVLFLITEVVQGCCYLWVL